MRENGDGCGDGRACSVQFDCFRGDLNELKERVGRLESTLAHGVMLLVANLVGVVVTLAQQLIR
jgi:hypothetical protein